MEAVGSFVDEDLLVETEGSDALSWSSSDERAWRQGATIVRPFNPHAIHAGTHPATREWLLRCSAASARHRTSHTCVL